MKKKIEVQDLRIGMYVAELDRSWLGTPFLFQGFEISTDEELSQLRGLCKHVFVLDDTADAGSPTRRTPGPATGKRTAAVHYEPSPPVHFLQATRKRKTPPPRYVDLTPVETELQEAREVEQGARQTLYTILDDARIGRSIDTPRAKQAVMQMTESVIRNPDALVWLTHLKKKHEYTVTHSLRVCVLALTFGRHLGYNPEQLNVLGLGALMHDIGKLRVPTEILDKPEALTREEFEIMKTHVPEGLKILETSANIPSAALEVVGRHHERYSGDGYAFGMSGDTIGEFGLISAIVDSYDAITSDRVYHNSLSAADALKLIYDGRGRVFHPWLTEQFIQCMGIFPIGSIVEMSNNSIGVVVAANRTRRLRPRIAVILSPDRKPYSPAPIVDLMRITHDQNGQPLEIKSVLPAGTFGINPTDFIPIHH